MKMVWLVVANAGVYADQIDYPVAGFSDEQRAQDFAQACRDNYGDKRYDRFFQEISGVETEYDVKAVPFDEDAASEEGG